MRVGDTSSIPPRPPLALFAEEWVAGRRPLLENYLLSTDDLGSLQALLRVEIACRRKAGEAISVDEYAARFPHLTRDQIDAAAAIGNGPPPADAGGSNGCGNTVLYPGSATPNDQEGESVRPRQIGRYLIERALGRGGFGSVYLARDDRLDRHVALKIPHSAHQFSVGETAQYLEEGRMAAGLDHPNIVPVYDVGSDDRHAFFLVSKYIAGCPLGAEIRRRKFSPREAADLVAVLGDALHHAHRHGVVHRDVKPGNVIIDASGRPYLTDFGLAMRERDFGKGSAYAGTPAYMSPEQARGEGHRVDGRSDVFSLGIVFYELLSGRRPFMGDSDSSILNRIATTDARPPRQFRDGIPRELERICLRALARRAADRYQTAQDFADDLRAFLVSAGSEADPPRSGSKNGRPQPPAEPATPSWDRTLPVVPHGLRSFDRGDADFFLALLPGPRDRDGIPESIRFWKTRIEDIDPDRTFPVGLIYGPSGCGKSSLVKAGLLPRLSDAVVAVYVEAVPGQAETRILHALRKQFAGLDGVEGLPEALAALRRERAGGGSGKILIVLDQFEQWLHAGDSASLVAALRQCDGAAVQCLILARDDFCVAVGRFFRDLEVPIREGHNYALVDLFDLDHARRVLHAFGHAYGRLPPPGDVLSRPQREFLEQAVAGLAADGKVISVRLALFTEMMRSRGWVPESLQQVGGAEGLGVTFLEKSFSSRAAPPTHRMHERAARAVLAALLPETGTDIKGRMQPDTVLLAESGYADRPELYRSLIDVLENEVRLIAATEPDDHAESGGRALPDGGGAGEGPRYQLTHDFLVPALREWLHRKQSETRRGRAALCLSERSALWSSRQEPKQLPDVSEWLQIGLLTRSRSWTTTERAMMRRAARRHLTRIGIVCAACVLAVAGGLAFRSHQAAQDRAEHVGHLVEQLWHVETRHLPDVLDRMDEFEPDWRESVNLVAQNPDASAGRRTRAYVALARHTPVGINYLHDRLLVANHDEHQLLRRELNPWKAQLSSSLWEIVGDWQTPRGRKLRAAAALAHFEPDAARWKTAADAVVTALLGEDPLSVDPWSEALRPVAGRLGPPLIRVATDPSADESLRYLAAIVIRRYAETDPPFLPAERLAEVALASPASQRTLLIPVMQRHATVVRKVFEAELAKSVPLLPGDDPEQQIVRQANAAELLLRIGHGRPFWNHLVRSDDPRLRTMLIARIQPGVVSWQDAAERLSAQKEGSIRQAIVLALESWRPALDVAERGEAAARLAELYRTDPDAGVHSACEWTLRRWGEADRLATAESRDRHETSTPRRDWFVNGQGQTMAIIAAPGAFQIGSPGFEQPRDSSENLRDVAIDQSFAIGTREVTVAEFAASRGEGAPPAIAELPSGFITWYDAVRYCRWLSEQEGIPESEMCYPPLSDIGPEMTLPPDWIRRTGYRLPTAAEWEYAVRAGSRTSRFYGFASDRLPVYAWCAINAEDRSHPVGQLAPNPFGLFDVYGNVAEWIDDRTEISGAPGARARGGHYRSTPKTLRSASMESYPLMANISIVGLRVAKTMADDP